MDLSRSSGILLHITSLPGPYGIGDLGPSAYRFADFLTDTKQRIWQVLPLVPVGLGNSPYSSPSTFAGNPLLISPEVLLQEGLLHAEDVSSAPSFPDNTVDFDLVNAYKLNLLEKAFDRLAYNGQLKYDYGVFVDNNRDWLEEYALFMTLREIYEGKAWTEWPDELRRRDPVALDEIKSTYRRRIDTHQFWQFIFNRQWFFLKRYCNERGIQILGDLPIYVAHDSADVWANQQLYFLDAQGNPEVVAGVPPDYFSKTGQRWGNPIYRWDLMKSDEYSWWTRRLEAVLSQVDIVRLDHFRAFEAYWEIPAAEETAVNGRWVTGPGADFFHIIRRKLGRLPLVAENLGLITREVTDLMETFNLPGMAVLHFAFDSGVDSSYLPHNYKKNLIAYTGTHDNDTTLGWWDNEIKQGHYRTVDFVRHYTGMAETSIDVNWGLIRILMSSVADLIVVPLQDVLGLGGEARMNTPGLGENNWGWRFTWDQFAPTYAERLRYLTELYGRSTNRYPY